MLSRKTDLFMISTLIFFLTMSTISAEPLNVQNAVDLDEDKATFSAPDSATLNDVAIASTTSATILSAAAEPVPKVDGVEPSSLPSYGEASEQS